MSLNETIRNNMEQLAKQYTKSTGEKLSKQDLEEAIKFIQSISYDKK